MTRLFAALALLLAVTTAAPSRAEQSATCDGYPKLPAIIAPGMCVGVVAAPPAGAGLSGRSLRMPRTLAQRPNGDWIVVDLGGWSSGQGSVWKLAPKPGQKPVLTPLLTRLTMPHGLGIGPDGRVYVGEMSRIIRFDPDAPNPAASVEVVVSGLPDNRLHANRHPLSNFIFDAHGSLLVNVGAPSDQCAPRGKPAGRVCAEREGPEEQAVVRRYRYLGGGRWDPNFEVFARGLRNSLAMARHPSGAILQGENSYDFAPRAETPFEEINLLTKGGDYGWPYCFDITGRTPAWKDRAPLDCRSKAHRKPAILMPPHAAPLGMLIYDGAMFPSLKGRLLVSYHGYRANSGRLLAFELDAQGAPIVKPNARYPVYRAGRPPVFRRYPGPAAKPRVLVVEYGKALPAPVGLAVAADGAIWLADDKNGYLLRIAADRP